MRPLWQTLRPGLASFAVVLIACGATLLYAFWPHCDRRQGRLAQGPNGESVVLEFEACTGMGTELRQRIVLRVPPSRSTTLLAYEPNPGIAGCKGRSFPVASAPTAVWTDPRHIRIAVPVLSRIGEQRYLVDGMTIAYELGPVIDVDCRK